tara:strand:- start:115 stop:867 length:753 start_codon:yes stop_codon:yes gene_type:complete
MEALVLTSYFSKKRHPNDPNDSHVIGRNQDLRVSRNSFDYIQKWYDSVTSNKLKSVVFHDDLSDQFVNEYQNEFVEFVKVHDSVYSNNDYRFFCFSDYLSDLEVEPDIVFHTDASDVVVVKNPTSLIEANSDHDFFACKDSIKINQFPYLQVHKNLNWQDEFLFMANHNTWDLINMGVVGGKFDNMLEFYRKFVEVRLSAENPDANINMWICQYLLRSVFQNKKTLIGDPVCSEFKQYENNRTDVYFIHK